MVQFDKSIDIDSEASAVDAGRALERSQRRLRRHVPSTMKREQLTHRGAVASDDKRFPSVELAHDLTAVVAQLSLSDLS